MARTQLSELRIKMEEVLDLLKNFENFSSPVNHAAVSAMWNGKADEQVIEVAVREYTGTFYRGRITETSANGHWNILADDGEIVSSVMANTFVAVRLKFLP